MKKIHLILPVLIVAACPGLLLQLLSAGYVWDYTQPYRDPLFRGIDIRSYHFDSGAPLQESNWEIEGVLAGRLSHDWIPCRDAELTDYHLKHFLTRHPDFKPWEVELYSAANPGKRHCYALLHSPTGTIHITMAGR